MDISYFLFLILFLNLFFRKRENDMNKIINVLERIPHGILALYMACNHLLCYFSYNYLPKNVENITSFLGKVPFDSSLLFNGLF